MADGDISAPVDTLVWNALAIEEPHAVHVSGDVYAIAYEEYDDKGKVATVTIDIDGNIGAALIDELTYENTSMQYPDIIHVSGNVFAIVHSGVDADGFLHTVTINDDGSIDDSVIDTYEFDTVNCTHCKLFHVAGSVYGIAYASGGDGKVATVTIADDGTITKSINDSLVYDTVSADWSTPLKVADNIFAIFYERVNGPGRVLTLNIADNGTITNTPISSLEIDAGVCLKCSACLVSNTIYAYAYRKDDYLYYMATVDIAATGDIGSVIDTLTLETNATSSRGLSVLRISDTIVCVTYSGPGGDGWMKTVEIDADGMITDVVLDSFEFDTNAGLHSMIIAIAGNVYAIFYRGTSGYGTIKTPCIDTPAGRPGHIMMLGIG